MSRTENTDNLKKADGRSINSNADATRQNKLLNEDIHDSPQDEEKM